ncbi:MAG TPA: PfkB family carbohydrate kinase [Candidatus Hydrogenedentes bacterium]|nr:PfkB family carbohydrate kinase [Candidatus Hydrogenedentota bacterium]
MSITVVGSVALDTVETPAGRNEEGLGGAATYFSLAAVHYAPVNLVGVVGDDFPQEYVDLFERQGINLEGLERAPGRTFRWTGRYHDDVNQRDTLETQLNVFEDFHPKLPGAARKAKYLFLGNIHPSLQLEVLEQVEPTFIALDTMNLWIDIAQEELKQVMARLDAIIINDSEVKQLTGRSNVVKGAREITALGPRIVVVKKGEHGCLLCMEDGFFAAPAFPLDEVLAPTGAGDTFAGGFIGYLAQKDSVDKTTLRQAVIHGSVVASFACEDFGPGPLVTLTRKRIAERYARFKTLVKF